MRKCILAMIITAMVILIGVNSTFAEPRKGSLAEIDLPRLPGAKVLREINWPAGKLLDDITKEFGPLFGLKELTQVSILLCQIEGSQDPEQVFKFYEPTITKQEWKTMDRRQSSEDASAIFFHEKKGLLIMFIGPKTNKGRELTIARLFGSMDPAKIGDTSGKLPQLFEKMLPADEPVVKVTGQARIPIGQPISVPPAEKLHIKSNRSDIVAIMVDGNTVELHTRDLAEEPGDLTRADDRLVLNLASRLQIERISVPAGIPVLFEPTEGSIDLSAARNSRPMRLSIVSVGAPVKIHDFPLVGGVHMIKATGAEVNIILTQVQGGEMVVATTGDDLSLEVPKNASVEITAQTTKGTITNLTSAKSDIEEKDKLKLTIGDGKARIALEAVNGNVCVKTSE